jgi:hypothetical protein
VAGAVVVAAIRGGGGCTGPPKEVGTDGGLGAM